MAIRKIIRIDEDLCNGCGDCVVDCAEGALQIVAGKAKLVREDFCDGFGDCVGTCPTGALTIEEREVSDFDPAVARAHVARTRGEQGLAAFDAAAAQHGQEPAGGCPGSRMRVLPNAGDGVSPSSPNPSSVEGAPAFSTADPGTIQPGNLGQWPVMLHLVPPRAPFFRGKELCVLSSCAPAAMPDAQWRFIRGRGVVMACPKLDRTTGYLEKLTEILAEPSIPRAVVARMEVPCCSGLTALVVQAAEASGRDDLVAVHDADVVRHHLALHAHLLALELLGRRVHLGDGLAALGARDAAEVDVGRGLGGRMGRTRATHATHAGALGGRVAAEGVHEVERLEGAVEGLAAEPGHGHVGGDAHRVAHRHRGLRAGGPDLFPVHLDHHVGVAGRVHGLDHGAADGAGGLGGGGRLVGGGGGGRGGGLVVAARTEQQQDGQDDHQGREAKHHGSEPPGTGRVGDAGLDSLPRWHKRAAIESARAPRRSPGAGMDRRFYRTSVTRRPATDCSVLRRRL